MFILPDGRGVSEWLLWQVAKLFTAAYNKAATMQNAVSGFKKCGINPFRPDIFTEEDFLPSMLTDRDEAQVNTGRPPTVCSLLINLSIISTLSLTVHGHVAFGCLTAET